MTAIGTPFDPRAVEGITIVTARQFLAEIAGSVIGAAPNVGTATAMHVPKAKADMPKNMPGSS